MATSLVQADEPFYTPKEIAARLKFSDRTVRDLFKGEEGVILLRGPEKPRKQRKKAYSTMRIPESVVERVIRRMSVKG